jgi:chromosome partitioning protein
MSAGFFTMKKALNVFGLSPEELKSRAASETTLPEFPRSANDNRQLKSWSFAELPLVGEKVGFMKKPAHPVAVAVFVTKGGVLKSSLTLNLARMAALHNIRTCVVGLDMQGDVTTALGGDFDDGEDSLEDAIARINSMHGLADVFTGQSKLADVIRSTDIPTLFYIPETPELVALDQSLINRNRREYWLQESIIAPLKEQFDLILMDCSPNWNRLITNALVASDVLVSPLECKINNFRNFKTFRALLSEFREDLRVNFAQAYVPTRLAPARRLSMEIYEWYRGNLKECTQTAIRESIQGEESVAMHISVPEYAPNSVAADEMRELLREVWETVYAQSKVTASAESGANRRSGAVAMTV